MIDTDALARSRDPEVLALSNLMDRVLRWVGRQDPEALAKMLGEMEDDAMDAEHRDLGEDDLAVIAAAYARQREMLLFARVQRLPPRLPRR